MRKTPGVRGPPYTAHIVLAGTSGTALSIRVGFFVLLEPGSWFRASI